MAHVAIAGPQDEVTTTPFALDGKPDDPLAFTWPAHKDHTLLLYAGTEDMTTETFGEPELDRFLNCNARLQSCPFNLFIMARPVSVLRVEMQHSYPGVVSAVAAVTAIYLSTQDAALLDRCARALGLLPDYVSMAASPVSKELLEPSIHQAVERAGILSAARTSMDKILDAYVYEDGPIVVHCQPNTRIGHIARQFARGNGWSAKSADLLDSAVVVNHSERDALGDDVAEVEQLLFVEDNVGPLWIYDRASSAWCCLQKAENMAEQREGQASNTYTAIAGQYDFELPHLERSGCFFPRLDFFPRQWDNVDILDLRAQGLQDLDRVRPGRPVPAAAAAAAAA